MSTISSLDVSGNKREGYDIKAMLDTGEIIDITEGFEFFTREQYDNRGKALEEANEKAHEAQRRLDEAMQQVDQMAAEIGDLNIRLVERPAEVRAPMLHVEHQDIPVGRTIDKLAPLGVLAPAPTLDEAPLRPELDPEAPARPPGPNEIAAHRGEYQGIQGVAVDDAPSTETGA